MASDQSQLTSVYVVWRTVIKELTRDGWYEWIKHSVKKGQVTVPDPKKDIPAGTLKSIERQARIKLS